MAETFAWQIEYLRRIGEPYWLLLYPEGSRYSLEKAKREESRRSDDVEVCNCFCKFLY